jgi:LPS sulfotransferase NodH
MTKHLLPLRAGEWRARHPGREQEFDPRSWMNYATGVSKPQEFVIFTHVRSGSSMLAEMLERNGIGAPAEHLNLRLLGENNDWRPADVLAKARSVTDGKFFGSKVMVHWLDVLKKRAGVETASDAQILGRLFGERFTMIHLYRSDTVSAAVSFTRANLSHEWRRRTGQARKEVEMPPWEALDHLISENVSWLDWCKHRLRMAAWAVPGEVIDMQYEELERDPATELRRAAVAITGDRVAASSLDATTDLVKQRDDASVELCQRWHAAHPAYANFEHR